MCLILIAHTAMLKTGRAEDQSIVKTPDLSNHPIYSKYKFNNTENVINLGTQPLFSPTVVFTTSSAEVDVAKAYGYHANSYLVKPVDFEKFNQLMDDIGFYWLAWNHHPWGD